ncbi:hypothetical protein FACS189431_3190 [Alphaproteobacteria bacterium]|nr:hypothetical protein FACS189431_3190 [Alphaproteobacteria bacterium]
MTKQSRKITIIGGAIVTVLALGAGAIYALITVTSPINVEYIAQTPTTLQGFTGDDCASMQLYTTMTLTDTRNSQNYRVRKMPDNHCWMIDNMKLADVTLTPADSNVTSNYNLMAISSTHGTDDDTPYVDDPALNSPFKRNCTDGMMTDPDSLTGCGYLYSWSAATASTGDGISSGNATGSICPSGWHLPRGSTAGEFMTGEFIVLNGSMLTGVLSAALDGNTDAMRANWWANGPFSGTYAGYFNGSVWSDQGYYGYWWSSDTASDTVAYFARVSYDMLNSGNVGMHQHYGYAIRCLL